MNQGAMANLLIGVVIALLPLFTKIGAYDLTRTSRDNLLIVLLGLISFILPGKERFASKSLYIAIAYGLFCLVINHWNPVSILVMMQMFYVSAGLFFFFNYYEKHSRDGQGYILNGMVIGCIIQSIIVICNSLNIPLWFYFIQIFYSGVRGVNIATNGIGSLGYTGMLSSYVAITSFGMFRRKLYWLLPFPIISLYLANSDMGWATMLAGVIYFLNHKFNFVSKTVLYLSSIVAMITVYFTGVGNLDSQRFLGWKLGFERVDLSHFLFGKGPGWFGDNGIVINPLEIMTQEHNEFISAFNMFGIVGILLLVPTFIKFLKAKDKSGLFPTILFAAFINSYGHFSLHQSTVAIIIIVAAGICLAEGDTKCHPRGTVARS